MKVLPVFSLSFSSAVLILLHGRKATLWLPAFRRDWPQLESSLAKRKDIIKSASINNEITFHCSRHIFATIALEVGIPVDVISKILGHKDLKTTQIYLGYFDEIEIQEMKKWNML